ncbi:MAG: LysM peptidoglycan-binding domain-containing protein [Bacilli bacterium]|nr:LysM peptidoglycan-binding domain-containing protein [Bacilli bacterium]
MYEIYKIMKNDTLESIAKEYDTDVNNLLEINGINTNNKLIPNNNIIVPTNKKNPYKYYTVKKGDTIHQISKDNNIDSNLLLKINGLDKDDYIYPNQTIILPNNNYKIYLTKNNDTVRGISESLNIEPEVLIQENPNIILDTNQVIIFKKK